MLTRAGALRGHLQLTPFAAPHGDDRALEFAQSLARDLAAGLGRGGSYGEWGLRAHVVAPRRTDLPADAAEPHTGERYVLEGDVADSGYAYAVKLRLVGADKGAQIWSERDMLQPSDLASESASRLRNVSWRMRAALIGAETQRVMASSTDPSAEELLLRARHVLHNDANSLEKAVEARTLIEQALALEPNLAAALMARCAITWAERDNDPNPDYARLAREMDRCSERALTLNSTDPLHWAVRAQVRMLLGRWIAALEANATASKLDPHNPRWFVERAWFMIRIGRPADALSLIEHALALDPALGWHPMFAAGMAHLMLGRADAAIAAAEEASGKIDSREIYLVLAAAYAHGGDHDRAAAARAEVLRTKPWYTIARVRADDEPAHPEYLPLAEKYWYEGLRKAGFPER